MWREHIIIQSVDIRHVRVREGYHFLSNALLQNFCVLRVHARPPAAFTSHIQPWRYSLHWSQLMNSCRRGSGFRDKLLSAIAVTTVKTLTFYNALLRHLQPWVLWWDVLLLESLEWMWVTLTFRVQVYLWHIMLHFDV